MHDICFSQRDLTKKEQKLYEHLLGMLTVVYNSVEREEIINTLDDLIDLLLGGSINER